MTPKDKADELFNKMYHADDISGNYPMCFNSAKQCALIAVYEIMSDNQSWVTYNYWQEVKEEIEQL